MDIRCFMSARQLAALAAVSKAIEQMKKLEDKSAPIDSLFNPVDPAVFTHTF
jgi:hypothetical protein